MQANQKWKASDGHQSTGPLQRRDFLRGALAAAACDPGRCGRWRRAPRRFRRHLRAPQAAGQVSEEPVRIAANSTVDAVIFKGGYGIDYAEFAGKQVEEKQPGVTVKVHRTTNIAQTLQPRFVAGNPPDVIDNSGANLIGINTIRGQLEDLTDVHQGEELRGQGHQGHAVRRRHRSREPSTASSCS